MLICAVCPGKRLVASLVTDREKKITFTKVLFLTSRDPRSCSVEAVQLKESSRGTENEKGFVICSTMLDYRSGKASDRA